LLEVLTTHGRVHSSIDSKFNDHESYPYSFIDLRSINCALAPYSRLRRYTNVTHLKRGRHAVARVWTLFFYKAQYHSAKQVVNCVKDGFQVDLIEEANAW
jgi:hypothetical protein